MKREFVRRSLRFFRPQVLHLESRLQPGSLLLGGVTGLFGDPVAVDPFTRDLALASERPALTSAEVSGDAGFITVGGQRVEVDSSNPTPAPVAQPVSHSSVLDDLFTPGTVRTASPSQVFEVAQLTAAATAVPVSQIQQPAIQPPVVNQAGRVSADDLQAEALTNVAPLELPGATDISSRFRNITNELNYTITPGDNGVGGPDVLNWSSYDSLGAANPGNDGLCGVDFAGGGLYVNGWADAGAGTTDVMVASKTADGAATVWTTTIDGPGAIDDHGTAIAVSGGIVYAAAVIDDPLPPPRKSPDLGPVATNGALIALDAATGAPLGAIVLMGGELNGVAVDANGNVWASGSAQGELTRDVVIAQFSADLSVINFAFTYHFTPDGVDAESDAYKCSSIDVDANGNGYISGFLYNGTDQQPLIFSVDGAGTPLAGTRFLTTGLGSFGTGVRVDSAGNIHLSGTLTTNGGSMGMKMQDALLARFNPDLTVIYAFRWFITTDGVRGDLKYYSIDANAANEAVIIGALWVADAALEDQDGVAIHFGPTGGVIVPDGFQGFGFKDAPALNTDKGCGIVLDGATPGVAYVVGTTLSEDFVTTPGVEQPTYAGGGDGWKARVTI